VRGRSRLFYVPRPVAIRLISDCSSVWAMFLPINICDARRKKRANKFFCFLRFNLCVRVCGLPVFICMGKRSRTGRPGLLYASESCGGTI
jgi:hypothetical protein